MPARDLQGEIRELRGRIAALMDEATNNEKLLRRSQERELELLAAENLAQLFEAICKGLKASYSLESVTLLLLDPQEAARLISEAFDDDAAGQTAAQLLVAAGVTP